MKSTEKPCYQPEYSTDNHVTYLMLDHRTDDGSEVSTSGSSQTFFQPS